MVNSNVRVGSRVQLFGYYSLSYANSDASGIGGFGGGGGAAFVPGLTSNSYNISQDYGRASFDVRDRFFLGGSIALPYLFRLSPFMVVSSGAPFNITSPIDVNGDQAYNDRPGLVSTATCAGNQLPTGPQNNIYCTPLGTFDALGGGKLLPINYGTGPTHFVMNLRLSKTFGFGPKAKSSFSGQQGQGGGGGGGGRGGGGRGGPLFGGGGPSFGVHQLRPPLQSDHERECPQRVQQRQCCEPKRGSGLPLLRPVHFSSRGAVFARFLRQPQN